MSLLLDALKKAAEQKAEKNKQETAETGSSDETLIETAAEDVSELEDGGLRSPQRGMQDETEIDNSDFDTRLERTRVEPEDGTETRLDKPDQTETETRSASAQMQTGEDETIIFAEEDVSDFMGEPRYVDREERVLEDETELSQLAPREDETGVGEPASRPQDDETDLSQLAPSEDETGVGELASRPQGDETDLSQLAPGEDETDVGELVSRPQGDETDLSQLAPGDDETAVDQQTPAVRGDETDLSQLAPREDDTDISKPFEPARAATGEGTEIGQAPAAQDETSGVATEVDAEDETDISVPPRSVADLEHAAAQQAEADQDSDVFDEDMSLLLVERDQTNLTGPTSATDPKVTQDPAQALQAEAGGDEELALVDTTQHRLPNEVAAGATVTSATTNVNQDTQTTRSATTSTQTSTRTYAPDNYDRTLMRLPSDDASKLFAGMKSDSDVVMTPEYAKKVFQSKSSAQRMQQYKIYGGIAFAILLVIAVYGLFEFQAQQENIDTSLRPLKRDPMPGLIRPKVAPTDESLFAEAEIDARTLSLLEGTESSGEPAVDDGSAAASNVEAEVQPATEAAAAEGDESAATATQTLQQEAPQEETISRTIARQDSGQTSDVSAPVEVATQIDAAEPAAGAAQTQAGSDSSTLEISSSQRPEQKQAWLREAYDAYQAGNDELALGLYNKVLEVDPGNRNALLARAAIYVQNNNSADAIRDYQKLLLANPKDSLAMTSLITVANYSPRETETQLKLMIRENPDSPYLNFALANTYSAQERWREAQGYYFRALQGNPGDPNYAYNLAVSLEHIAQPRAAIAYYQRALDNYGNGLATFSRDVVDQRLEVLKKL